MITINSSTLADTTQLLQKVNLWQNDHPIKHLPFEESDFLPPYLKARVRGWISNGIDAKMLMDTLRSLPQGATPGSTAWIHAFDQAAESYAKKIDVSSSLDDAQKCQILIQASSFHYLARWPHVFSEQAKKSYIKSKILHEKASQYFDCHFEILDIEHDSAHLKAHFYRPHNTTTTYPLIFVSGGMDVWKTDLEVQSIITVLLSHGFAVCAFDMPGTGENPLPLSPGAITSYQSLFEHIAQRHDVDPNKLGFYGLSFGGYWSTLSALTFPHIKAVVNVGGPIHHAFQKENFESFQIGTQKNIAQCFNKDLSGFSWLDFENLALSKESIKVSAVPPILTINGAQDELVPIAEMDYLDTITQHDKLIYHNDRHVASYNQREHLPFAVKWLQKHLTAL